MSPPSLPLSPSSPPSCPLSPTPPSVAVAILDFEDNSTDPPTKETYTLSYDQTLKFGRDQGSNNHAFDSPRVSRNHLEFFAVSFDDTVQPMIYVRDRQSFNGTRVNGRIIGKGPQVTSGRLLEHGDVVSIKPNWKFTAKLPAMESESLTEIQYLEAKLFEDQYKISDTIIGTGGSTTVRVAYDIKTGQQLACKIYDIKAIGQNASQAEIDKIMCGLHMTVQLEHPNIACFKRAYKSKYTVYVFEELATGGDLFALSCRYRRFIELEVRWMIRQVLMAVSYLHKKGVVHRDIKSENVLAMVCPQPAHRLALTDFGHADIAGHTHHSVGTRGWQAPELFQKDAYHGTALDMWSMGIMAVHLLCGGHEVHSLNDLEEILPQSPQIKSVDFGPIIQEINMVRSESASGHELREDFIRRCLDCNQKTRMTAAEALKHPWVDESLEMRKLFDTRHEQTTEAWTPRKIHHQPICDLYDVLRIPKVQKKATSDRLGVLTRGVRTAKKSPYFKSSKKSCKVTKMIDISPAQKSDESFSPKRHSPLRREITETDLEEAQQQSEKLLERSGSPPRAVPEGQSAKYSRTENKAKLLEVLRKSNLKFLPRTMTWPYGGEAVAERKKRNKKKRTRSGGEAGRKGTTTRRKIVRDPSDGNPINFDDPWVPV